MGVHTNFKKFLKRTYPGAFLRVSGVHKKVNTPKKTTKTNTNDEIEVFDDDEWQDTNDKSQSEQLLRGYVQSPFTPISGHPDQYKFPNDVHVCIHDATGKLKVYPSFLSRSTKTTPGMSFVMDYVLAEANAFLNLPQAEAFYLCFDRGSPPNKGEEQARRRKNVQLMDISKLGEKEVLIDDSKLPSEDQWLGFINHPKLNCELLHYVSKRIIEPHPSSSGSTYTPPLSPEGRPKILFLFGGDLSSPITCRIDRERKERPRGCLYYVENIPQHGEFGFKTHRNHGLYGASAFSESDMEWLLEGEMSASYFSKPSTDARKNIMIISGGGDGDVIIQTLLACKDRIDLRTGTFKNKVYVRLVVAGQTEDVDINKLYELIKEDPIFKGIENPEVLLAACSCLAKNDYFDGFGKGLGNIKKDKDSEMLTVIHTMIKHVQLYGSDMIKVFVYQGDGTLLYEDHHRDHLVPPTLTYSGAIVPPPYNRSACYPYIKVKIDEDLFIQYTKQCYMEKYYIAAFKKKAKGKDKNKVNQKVPNPLDTDYRESLRIVMAYLDAGKKTCNKIMKTAEIRVYARMLEWTLEYFYNGYRQGAKNIITSVLSTFGGYSYYGWVPASLISTLDDTISLTKMDTDDEENQNDTEDDETLFLQNVKETELLNTKCRKADRVSLKRPSDRQLHVFLEKNKIVLNIRLQAHNDNSSSSQLKSITSTILDDNTVPKSRALGNSIETHLGQVTKIFNVQNTTSTEAEIINSASIHNAVVPLKRLASQITAQDSMTDNITKVVTDEQPLKKRRLESVQDQHNTSVSMTVHITPQTTIKPLGLTKTPVIRTHLLLKKRL